MDRQPEEFYWRAIEYAGWLVSAVTSTALGVGWRRYSRDRSRLTALERQAAAQDSRTSTLAAAIEEIVSRQDRTELEVNNQRVLLAEIKIDVKWIRETLERQPHRRNAH